MDTKEKIDHTDLLKKAVAVADNQRQLFITEMLAFLRYESVGTEPKRKIDTENAAKWLAQKMESSGLENINIFSTKGNPIVYGEWLKAGSEFPTVLVYGHYDVQPADPLDLWDSPPFEPVIKDDYIYGRGAADDKGQLLIPLNAVNAYLDSDGHLPLNVKFVIEGEEESGSQNLSDFILNQKALLDADVALISDSHILSPEQPAIVYGLRGMCYIQLEIEGPGSDLHSGSYGGGIDNPLNVLCHIVAKLKDEDGRILIPGFYDSVRPLSSEEKKYLAEYPISEEEWLAEAGAPNLWGEPEFTLAERIGARPTLDINGINGGYTGIGSKTVLPAKAQAKISMRLVPDQKPEKIFELIRNYISDISPETVKVNCSYLHGGLPSITDLSIPAMKAASKAYEEVFGRRPVYYREGGTLPVVGMLQKHLDLETVLMGFGLPDDQIHAPNERFYLPNFFRGIETVIHFFKEYSTSSNRR